MNNVKPYVTAVSNSFIQMPGGQITGKIYFQFGEKTFPESDWNDFVVVMLCWWLKAVIQMIDGIKENAELLFMDGPFSVRILTQGRDRWRLECIERRKNVALNPDEIGEVVEYRTMVESLIMLKSLLSVACETIHRCKKNEWILSDLDLLISLKDQLQNRLAKLSSPEKMTTTGDSGLSQNV